MKLEKIANTIGYIGMTVATATFCAMVLKMLIQVHSNPDRHYLEMKNLMEVLDAFIIAVTVIVVAVPEGLPLAVTISLAFSVSKMADLNNLVRKLDASETMGGADQICTDKTGTLTQNKMTVMSIYHEGKVTVGSSNPGLKTTNSSKLLAESVMFNCSAFVESVEAKQHVKGNVTEVGLLRYLIEAKFDVENMLRVKTQEGFALYNIPFNSIRKR